MRLRRKHLAPGASLALCVAAWLCFGPPYTWRAASAPTRDGSALERRAAPVPDRSLAASPGHGSEASDERAARTAQGPRPASLAGTDVDGELAVDPSGAFVPAPEALRLFDYFLSATGEEPLEVIRARIVDEISRRLSGSAASQAVVLLDRYLAYRDAAEQLAASGAAPGELDQRMQWLRELRRKIFGADAAEALFGEAEAVSLIDLEQRRARSEEDLPDEALAARIEDLESRLPAAEREARRESTEPARVHLQVAALREAGADAREVDALRERAFGREAAERLAALDRERAGWHARLDRYAERRDAILADARLSDVERREATDALRASSFESLEQLRIRQLDEAR